MNLKECAYCKAQEGNLIAERAYYHNTPCTAIRCIKCGHREYIDIPAPKKRVVRGAYKKYR